jgi:serine/threonine protein kinase
VRLDQRLILERGKKKERLTRNLLNNLFFLFSRRCKVCRDIVTGMDYLAKKGIIHRDLAARNVLIRKLGFGDVLCKLCDFGMGRALVEDAYVVSDPKATELPVRWTAPEALEKKRYSLKSDVFSFGVLVWEVESFGAEPYVGWPLGSILKRLKAGERLEQPTGCPDTLYSVMLQCWDLDPDKRPSWESLYNMFKDAWRQSSPMESSGKFDEKEELDAGSKIYQDADLGYNQQYLLQGNGEDGYGAGAYVAPDKNSSTTTTPTSRSMSMSEYDSDAEASSESYSIITGSNSSNVSSSAARPPVLLASGTAAVSVMRSSSNHSPESNKSAYGYLRSSANDAGARDSSSESEGRSLQRRATASSPFCRRESSAAAAPGLNASRSACDIKREKKKQQRKDPAKLREENEAFVIRTLTEQEPKMLWKALHYFEGTLAEAKEEAKATQKPIYMTMLVNGPEPEVPCVGARLFRCTVLSDQRIIDHISQNFIPVLCNLSEQKFPDELFRPALNEILFWYNSLQPGSSLNWSGEIVIDVDSNGVSTLVGGCSWIHDELENLFCYEGFTRMLDKAMKKREDIQSMKQNRAEKKVVGTIKSAFNVAKGELARGANDIKHAWSFRKQMKVAPVTDETLYRLQYNGLLEGKRKQNASDAAAEVKPE